MDIQTQKGFFTQHIGTNRARLDDADLVGNIEGIMISGKLDISLLLAVRADQSVDALGVDGVHLLNGILDLVLVGMDVNDKDQSVVILNLLHGALSGEGEAEDGELQIRREKSVRRLEDEMRNRDKYRRSLKSRQKGDEEHSVEMGLNSCGFICVPGPSEHEREECV